METQEIFKISEIRPALPVLSGYLRLSLRVETEDELFYLDVLQRPKKSFEGVVSVKDPLGTIHRLGEFRISDDMLALTLFKRDIVLSAYNELYDNGYKFMYAVTRYFDLQVPKNFVQDYLIVPSNFDKVYN